MVRTKNSMPRRRAQNRSRRKPTRPFTCFEWYQCIMLLVLLVGGSVVGWMHLQFREVKCLGYERDGYAVLVDDGYSKYEIKLMAGQIFHPDFTNTTATCWSNADVATFNNPNVVMSIFFLVWSILFFLPTIVIWSKSVANNREFIRSNVCGIYGFVVLITLGAAWVVVPLGGLIFGFASLDMQEGYCTKYVRLGGNIDRNGYKNGYEWGATVQTSPGGKLQSNDVSITIFSPMPKLSAKCWLAKDAKYATFINPKELYTLFFIACGITVGVILFVSTVIVVVYLSCADTSRNEGKWCCSFDIPGSGYRCYCFEFAGRRVSPEVINLPPPPIPDVHISDVRISDVRINIANR
jgi:hypothetical protein